MAILTFPFRLIWGLFSAIMQMTGRLLAIVFGIILLVTGMALTATVIGAILGVPVMIFGGLLLLRGLF